MFVKSFMTVWDFFSVCLVFAVSVGVRGQLQSPCPRTFQYERDRNGELYGTVGVYSFEDNVDLDVELSVGNQINGNNNGFIKLTIPKDQVVDKVRSRQPLQYDVYFPPWTNQPPRVTKITVNGQIVCSGPPAEFDHYSRVVSTVTLSHRFISTQPLSFNSRPPLNGITNPENPFFIQREPSGSKNPGNPFLTGNNPDTGGKQFPNQGPNQNFGNEFNERNQYDLDFLNVYFTTTPRTTTRSTRRPSVPTNDIPFSENPFLSGRGSVAPPTRTRTRTRRPTTTQPPPTRRRITRPPPTPPRADTQSSTSSVCGIPVVPNPLIVNGKSVPPGAFPWLAAVYVTTGRGADYRCCGSLVSHKHIITAAHCVQQSREVVTPLPPHKFIFYLGKHNLENLLVRKGEMMVGAQEIKVHPEYVSKTSDADIAVIILNEEVQYTSFIRPICMWSETDELEAVVGERGKVVGWGTDGSSKDFSPEPKQATIRIVSQEQCLRSGAIFKYITSTRSFCAGERNVTAPCNGDSGSGFIMKRGGRWALRGIVSIASYDSDKDSCDISQYVAYTDVSKFRTWLSTIIIDD